MRRADRERLLRPAKPLIFLESIGSVHRTHRCSQCRGILQSTQHGFICRVCRDKTGEPRKTKSRAFRLARWAAGETPVWVPSQPTCFFCEHFSNNTCTFGFPESWDDIRYASRCPLFTQNDELVATARRQRPRGTARSCPDPCSTGCQGCPATAGPGAQAKAQAEA